MAYVIAEPCINTKDTACVDACPVDCIHPKKDSDKFATEEMLYIDPSSAFIAARACRFARFRGFSRWTICPRSGKSTPSATPSISAVSHRAISKRGRTPQVRPLCVMWNLHHYELSPKPVSELA